MLRRYAADTRPGVALSQIYVTSDLLFLRNLGPLGCHTLPLAVAFDKDVGEESNQLFSLSSLLEFHAVETGNNCGFTIDVHLEIRKNERLLRIF
jgi:hypothetical protein